MAVDDLWYSKTRRGPGGKPLKLARHGRGKRYRVRYTDPNTGKPKTELFEKKADADRRDANQRADISRGQYLDPSAGKVTVYDRGEQWQAGKVQRDSTLERIEGEFRRHVYPHIGDMAMSAVKKARVQTLVKELSEDLAPRTVGQILIDLKAMFGDAVGELIAKNPCIGVKVPELEDIPRYIPTAEEVWALGEGINRRYRLVPYIAAGCGLRPGEIHGLELDSIDFDARTVSVERQLAKTRKNGLHLARLKTKQSRRTLELPAVTMDALAAHVEEFPPVPVEILDLSGRKPETRFARLLVTTSNRLPPSGSTQWKAWQAALNAAALFDKDLTLHGLRHYFATLLIHAGKDVKTVQLALGHSKPSITLDTYLHEWPKTDDRTRGIVDAAFANLVSRVDEVTSAA